MNKLVLLYIYIIYRIRLCIRHTFFFQFSSQSRGASYRRNDHFGTQPSVFHHNPTILLLCLFCWKLPWYMLCLIVNTPIESDLRNPMLGTPSYLMVYCDVLKYGQTRFPWRVVINVWI